MQLENFSFWCLTTINSSLPDYKPTRLCSYSLMLNAEQGKSKYQFYRLGLTRLRLQSMTYRTWGEHVDHYTTNEVIFELIVIRALGSIPADFLHQLWFSIYNWLQSNWCRRKSVSTSCGHIILCRIQLFFPLWKPKCTLDLIKKKNKSNFGVPSITKFIHQIKNHK